MYRSVKNSTRRSVRWNLYQEIQNSMNINPLAPRPLAGTSPSTRSAVYTASRQEAPRSGPCIGWGTPTEMVRPVCAVKRSMILASRWMAESA